MPTAPSPGPFDPEDRTKPIFFEPPAGSYAPPAPPPTEPLRRVPAPPVPGTPSRRAGGGRTALVVVAALVGGAISGGIVADRATHDAPAASSTSGSSATGNNATSAGNNTSSIAKPQDVQGILAKVEPGVVSIRTQAARAGRFFPSSGAGTGMVLTADGEVLTNAHVVSGATTIEVRLTGETTWRAADLVGANTAEDVAVVKIRSASGLKTVELGKSSDLKVGDDVIAIGNALDLDGGLTVTEGIVSALNRSISDSTENLSGLIQTDAAINPGNSGGALVNSAGQVVGMNTAVAGDAQNIGFAIAIDKAKPLVEAIRTGTPAPATATQAYLGIGSQTIDPTTAAGLGLAQTSGAYVTSVETGSAAEKAGLRTGDVITSIGGAAVTSSDDLSAAIKAHKPGDAVDIVWTRARQRVTAQATLGGR